VILKKPPTFTWPVMSVVADSVMAASMPLVSEPRSTSRKVTAASAPPRNRFRRVWAARFRAAIWRSMRSTVQSSVAIASTGETLIAMRAG
jgi:hypothetical protein